MKKTILTICLLLFGVGLYYFNYSNEYFINYSNKEIEAVLEESMGTDITIRGSRITDNKVHFVFTFGKTVGSGELSQGWNNKYRLEFYGHGTNWIRERIIKTKAGQYLLLAGRNDVSIGSIKAYIEDDEYNIKIPFEEYYVVTTPVKETSRDFTSAKIIYDRDGKEIERINLPSQ